MITPWFSAATAQYLAFLSLFAAVGGLDMFVKQGRYRQQVQLAYALCASIGAVLAFAGAMAWLGGQPRYVLMPLLGAGAVIALAFGHGLVQLNQRYTDAELRRMAASDI